MAYIRKGNIIEAWKCTFDNLQHTPKWLRDSWGGSIPSNLYDYLGMWYVRNEAFKIDTYTDEEFQERFEVVEDDTEIPAPVEERIADSLDEIEEKLRWIASGEDKITAAIHLLTGSIDNVQRTINKIYKAEEKAQTKGEAVTKHGKSTEDET